MTDFDAPLSAKVAARLSLCPELLKLGRHRVNVLARNQAPRPYGTHVYR
jgi:hypothetical protein